MMNKIGRYHSIGETFKEDGVDLVVVKSGDQSYSNGCVKCFYFNDKRCKDTICLSIDREGEGDVHFEKVEQNNNL